MERSFLGTVGDAIIDISVAESSIYLNLFFLAKEILIISSKYFTQNNEKLIT